jgi:hypothetical protein
MAGQYLRRFMLIALLALGFGSNVLAAPRSANGEAIASVQLIGSGDFCLDRDPSQCGISLQVKFVNGTIRLIQKESWAGAIQGYDISADRLSLRWDLVDAEPGPAVNGFITGVDGFRAGNRIHSFECGHIGNYLGSHFAAGGKWIVISCGDYHQEGDGVQLLMDVASGRRIGRVDPNARGEIPKGAPKWARD